MYIFLQLKEDRRLTTWNLFNSGKQKPYYVHAEILQYSVSGPRSVSFCLPLLKVMVTVHIVIIHLENLR